MLSAQIERTRKEGQQIRVYRPNIRPVLPVSESVHESDDARQGF